MYTQHAIRFLFLILVIPFFVTVSGCSAVGGADPEYTVVPYEGEAFDQSGVIVTWVVEVDGNRLILRETSENLPDDVDDQAQFLRVTVENIDNELPDLVDVWMGPEGGGVGTKAKKSRLEVQSWDVEGEISGVLVSDIGSTVNVHSRFWIDLSE